jgi:hypothetical protein
MAPNDDNNKEKYACDSCRSSKVISHYCSFLRESCLTTMQVTCSRERSGCKRCKKKGAQCAYSRSGVLRRRRARSKGTTDNSQVNQEAAIHRTSIATGANSRSSGVQSYLTADIEATRERLSGLDHPERHGSLSALSSLSKICASTGVQHEASELGTMGNHFFLFEEYAIEWAKGRNLLI